MSTSAEYTRYAMELLEPIGRVHTTPFFGGVGICRGAVQFAMIMRNSLYFVVDDVTRRKYEGAGMAPFSYVTRRGRVQVRRYFELPEDVLTDPDQLRVWAREAIEIASKNKSPAARKAKGSRRAVSARRVAVIRRVRI